MSAWFFPFIYQIQNNDLAPYYPPKVTSFFRIIINWGFSHLWCVWIHFSNYAQIVPSFLRRLLIFRVHFLNLTFELSYNVLASESFWHDLISLWYFPFSHDKVFKLLLYLSCPRPGIIHSTSWTFLKNLLL